MESLAHWTGVLAVSCTALAAAFGLAAWYFSNKASAIKETQLAEFRESTSARVAEAGEATARAQAVASIANARAAEAESTAAEAREGTARALAEAATATERTRALELAVEQRREIAAVAEKELIELKQRLNPRSISPELRLQLTKRLRGVSKGPVEVDTVIGDKEGNEYARQIDSILKDAGWETSFSRSMFSGSDPVGLSIVVRDTGAIPEHAKALLQAFDSIGLRAAAQRSPQIKEGVVKILVGVKEEPTLDSGVK